MQSYSLETFNLKLDNYCTIWILRGISFVKETIYFRLWVEKPHQGWCTLGGRGWWGHPKGYPEPVAECLSVKNVFGQGRLVGDSTEILRCEIRIRPWFGTASSDACWLEGARPSVWAKFTLVGWSSHIFSCRLFFWYPVHLRTGPKIGNILSIKKVGQSNHGGQEWNNE